MDKLLDIFRPGRHTAMSGDTLAFTEADVAAMAKAYDPARHEAPLVVGHPKVDAPAYGWVKTLAFAEGRLQAEPHQVDETFAGLVQKGRFKKISASFYTPDAPNNPVPGVYYLRHVGFLGAQAPAVKGLRDASFADGEEGIVAFGDLEDRIETGLWRRMREWIIAKFGLEEADKVLPGWDVDQLKTLADQPKEGPAPNPAFAEEARMKQDLERREAELKAKEEALQERTAAFAEQEKAQEAKALEALAAERLAFADGLVKDGKLNPIHKEPLAAFMATIAPEATLSFGEGEDARTESTLDWFKALLSALPGQLSFGEIAGHDGASAGTVGFAAPPGCEVDAAGLERHAKASAYMKAHPNTSFIDAVKAVSQES